MDEYTEPESSHTETSEIAQDCQHGLVVAGEASESDEEFIDVSLPIELKTDMQSVSHFNVDKSALQSGMGKTSKAHRKKNPRFNSLLHQKLREKNEELYRCLRELLTDAYTSSARRLFTISSNLSKSESALQDASNNMRLQTNDLFHLEDKLDIITSCHLLPDINI